jgi:type 2 lantibiotic biosynthesis protein LanM
MLLKDEPNRFERWVEYAASGDLGAFAIRLRALGLSEDDARNFVNSDPCRATKLAERDFVECVMRRYAHDCIAVDESIAFSDALSPFLAYAKDRIPRELHCSGLMNDLCRRLSLMATPTLYVVFGLYLTKADPMATMKPPDPSSNVKYIKFVEYLRNGGWCDVVRDYPVLEQALAIKTRNFINSISELSARLISDRAMLEGLFGVAGDVVTVESGLSDPHHGGRTVALVSFGNAKKVVYKPKPIDADAAYAKLVKRLPFDLVAPIYLPREGYGWGELIEEHPCRSTDEVERYYRRIGKHLALFLVLNVSDCHHENIVARGDQPVFIDLEVMMTGHPRLATELSHGEESSLARAVRDSVLWSHVLPTPETGGFDPGGLAGRREQSVSMEKWKWIDLNTDAIRPIKTQVPLSPQKNSPTLPDYEVDPGHYTNHVIQGFCVAYRWLAQCDANWLLEGFANVPVRFVLRKTETYARLLDDMSNPEDGLRDWRDLFLKTERLARAFVQADVSPPLWRILDTEAQMLMNWDVPMFLTTPSCTELCDVEFFEQTGIERSRARMNGLSEDDLAFQVGLIDASFAARAEQLSRKPAKRGGFIHDSDLVDQISHHIGNAARRLAGGRLAWFGLRGVNGGNQRCAPLDPGLYDGLTGVAVFLAAAGQIDAAQGAVALISDMVDNELGLKLPSGKLSIGVAGVGGIIYGLSVVADILKDDGPRAVGIKAADLIDTRRIENDTVFDLIDGNAGAIIGLLRIGMTERAMACGRRLLNALAAGDNLSAIRRITKVGKYGIAHGHAGIALALSRLGYHETACVVMGLDEESSRQSSTQWCNGTTGDAFVRLDLGVDVREQIESIVSSGPGLVDSPCCGELGRAELLLVAGMRLDCPVWVADGQRRIAAVAEGAIRTGHFRLRPFESDEYNFGLFTGLAGVGYQLIRSRAPGAWPSILAWN